MSPAVPPQPSHPDSRFDADWLALRADADAAARAGDLTDLAAAWLSGRPRVPYLCVDLGAGSGSNPRFLAPRLPGPQSWRLLDHDAALLERAARDCGTLRDVAGGPVDLRPECRDLSVLTPETLGSADLVCASALIDLVGASFLDRLAEACAGAGAAVLFSLSVDGEWRCERAGAEDVDPDDALVRAAFNAHQRQDKGVGAALGRDAPAYLVLRLRRHGYRVRVAPSPWRLDTEHPRDAALAAALSDGWLAAALEQEPAAAARLSAWHVRRKAALDEPAFALTVGHVDLFACPGGSDPVSRDEG